MARPSHDPDPLQRRQVEALAGFGIGETDIAAMIGIDPKTLRKHYRDELDLGHIKANAKVAESLFRKATGEGREAVTAAIFWAKTRMGWREKGEPKGPETTEVVIRRFSVDWEPAQSNAVPVKMIDGTLD